MLKYIKTISELMNFFILVTSLFDNTLYINIVMRMLMLLFVFVSDEFDTNTVHFYIYLFCENSFFMFFFATSGKNWVLSQAVYMYILPTCPVRDV